MEQFTNLPTSIKALLGTLSAGFLGAVLFIIDRRAIGLVLGGLLVVILLFCLYLLVLRMLRKRQAARMGGDMAQHSTVAPRGLSDPSQRAKLDNLRQNFQRGVDKFRASGKDIYKLPWYLVIGEPGAGKTEAIRHCNVGFPPGLQDELQGAGGTINMNWWFTNHAILLDTAGRLMFEEVAAGSTSEWREFLGLLRRSRPNCPINGLVLVIPADSLVKESTGEIGKKASRIAQQLNTIQEVLDVRFPVFVLITKTDLINGFREFFEHVTDPALQHQILGWSNPDELDQPFRPELVDQHLQQVVARVRRRRLGLLQDPTPRGEAAPPNDTSTPWNSTPDTSTSTSARRLDEVDSLFSLPTSVGFLAPRLRRYLEMIFVPNEWSGKPLFLRGIYFTSAMRVGSALDAELAEAVGVPVDSLPAGKTWEQQGAYFLRDLFMEKIFKERGLVTRATNTRTMLRRKQAIMFGCGFAALALLLTFSWIGASSLSKSVGGERAFWLTASEGWQDGVWRPIVSLEFKGSTNYEFNRSQELVVGNEKMTLPEYHRRLAELAQSDINIPWVFRPMGQWVAGANANRKRAQRIVYEGGVVKPIVQATRGLVEGSRDNWSARSSEALTFLVRLEGMIYNRAGLISEELSAASFLKPAGSYLWKDPKPDEALSEAFNLTYLKGEGRGYWPPRWLSGGFTLEKNQTINIGVREFLQATVNSQKTQETGFEHIKKVRAELRALLKAEEALKVAAQTGAPTEAVDAAYAAFVQQLARIDPAMKEAAQSSLFPPGPIQLFVSYKQLVEAARNQSETSFKQLQTEIARFTSAMQDNPKEGPFTIAEEIRRKMIAVKDQIKVQAEGTFNPEELTELQTIDRLFLEKTPGGEPIFTARAEIYDLAAKQMRDSADASASLAGNFARQLEQVRTGITTAKEKGARYQGAYAPESAAIVRRLLEVAHTRRVETLFDRYLAETEGVLRGSAAFPLLSGSARTMTAADVRKLAVALRMYRDELPALRSSQPPDRLRPAIDLLEKRVKGLTSVADALLNEDGKPALVKVTLPSIEAQQKRLGSQNWIARFAGAFWRELRVNNRKVRAGVDEELAKVSLADEALTIDLIQNPDDSKPERSIALFSGDWGALRLLQQSTALRRPGGKEWEIILSQKDVTGAERVMVLVLGFDKLLPEMADWPNAKDLEL